MQKKKKNGIGGSFFGCLESLLSRSFVDFGVLLNYNFGLPTASGGKMGGIEERWVDPSKPAEFLGSAEEWHHVRPSSGRREREARPKSTSLAESRCAKNSADHNIYFYPKLCGFGDTGHATK